MGLLETENISKEERRGGAYRIPEKGIKLKVSSCKVCKQNIEKKGKKHKVEYPRHVEPFKMIQSMK